MNTLRTVALLMVAALSGGNTSVHASQTWDARSVLTPVNKVAGLWGGGGLTGAQFVVQSVVV